MSSRARNALAERLALVASALNVVDLVEIGRSRDVTRLHGRSLHYLLDANQATCAAALMLAARRVRFVVDTGDDPRQLARNHGLRSARPRGWAADQILRRAAAVIHRGFFHGPVLRATTDAPLLFAADTAPDAVIDRPAPRTAGPVIASFGSAATPAQGDRAYGWEVVDAVAATPGVRGVLVVRGPGIESLRARARRLGVIDRMSILGPVDVDGLVGLMEPATIVTSMQSDDLAGWVRTTGKLPLALGMGKMVASSAVGEATRVLPAPFLLPDNDDVAALRIGALARECMGGDAPRVAKGLAEPFRRSTVALSLRAFVAELSP